MMKIEAIKIREKKSLRKIDLQKNFFLLLRRPSKDMEEIVVH